MSFSLSCRWLLFVLYLSLWTMAVSQTVTGIQTDRFGVFGGASLNGTVTLSSAAPVNGIQVNLSSNSSAATVPSSVFVPHGATTASFVVGTTRVTATTTATLQATLGSSVATANLTILLFPPPSDLTLTAYSDTAMDVTWTPTLTVTGFDIRYRIVDHADWQTQSVGYVSSLRVTGLTPRSAYEFQIRSTAVGASSDWSASIVGKTQPSILPLVPPALTVDDNDGDALLSWTEAGPGVTYVVQRALVANGEYAVLAQTQGTMFTDESAPRSGPVFYIVTCSSPPDSVQSNVVQISLSERDGGLPVTRPLITSSGTVYGATLVGGSHATGTLYRLDADDTVHTVYSFDALTADGTNVSGIGPDVASLVEMNGKIWGSTHQGGPGHAGTGFFWGANSGADFSLFPASTPLVATSNSVLGIVPNGGSYWQGLLFGAAAPQSNDIDGWFAFYSNFPDLDSFNTNTIVAEATHGMTWDLPGRYLYGASNLGGANGFGGVFRFDPQNNTLASMCSFPNIDNPQIPAVMGDIGLVAAGSVLLGASSEGGLSATGTVFIYDPAGLAFSVVLSFPAMDDAGKNTIGAHPNPDLVRPTLVSTLGSTLVYGTTRYGGQYGFGTVFSVDASGVVNVIYSFDGANGGHPMCGLVMGADGSLRGTTRDGGFFGAGVLFRITPAGVYTVVHSFRGGLKK
jgi:uncharacterized repeat protein (TIGR03803 family)